ncbi:MAG: histone deacetylase family protein [Pseudomonadota bacterium]|nr:histone deacetylase family protein [Pseudomonadota bacterium]
MSTLYITHPAFLHHLTGPGHPERPDRMRAVERIMENERFAHLARETAPLGKPEAIELVHPTAYVEALEEACPRDGLVRIDADTVISPGSWEAALRGVGAACYAVDEVLGGRAANAFCAIRPPGHHAETARAMGFCLVNFVSIAARHAQRIHGVERVAIVDVDVHHGNGTQDIFWSDASVFYASTHQMPLYPGTGAVSETGVGNIVNAPLRPGDGGEAFRQAVETRILPALERFGPDLVLISAGFDAHWRDPLAHLQLTEQDFAWVTRKLMDVAARFAKDRVVSLLEGGYDLQGLSRSVEAHVLALMRG